MSEESARPERKVTNAVDRVRNFGRLVLDQLKTADLNPHEGRLRASVVPVEYIEIPDHPPIHDDTIS